MRGERVDDRVARMLQSSAGGISSYVLTSSVSNIEGWVEDLLLNPRKK
jgi:hypothetical protein